MSCSTTGVRGLLLTHWTGSLHAQHLRQALVQSPPHEVAGKLALDGHPPPPASLCTSVPPAEPAHDRTDVH
ncbi:hypothetical protein BJY59DRAFT_503962 [Rhodotorula toruloides]